MARTIRALLVAGALAGTTMIAAPAAAATPMPAPMALGSAAAMFDSSRYDQGAQIADWRCRGWNCGYGGRRGGWRRNRVGAGDVLIGAAIIGGVAAILSSNNRRARDRDVVIVERDRTIRDRDWQRDDPRYRDDRRVARPAGVGGAGSSGLDSAVDMCLARIERDVRVDTVDNVERTASGWLVSGSLFNGSGFACRIGNSGQIDGIDYGGGFAASATGTDGSGAGYDNGAAPRGAGQWDDNRYSSARAAVGGSVRPDMAVNEAQFAPDGIPVRSAATDAMPAYPGGPIPGEVIPETADGDL